MSFVDLQIVSLRRRQKVYAVTTPVLSKVAQIIKENS